MNMWPYSLRAFLTPLLLIGMLPLWGCDSADDEVDPGDVAGEYIFNEFRFVPDSPLLPAAVLLDTLVASNTRLQLFSSGRFTLLYQFEGASPEFIGGDFDVNEDRVRLNGREDETEFYQQLLIGTEFTLQRDESETLSATIPRTVHLEDYSDRYRGLRSVSGVVVLALARR